MIVVIGAGVVGTLTAWHLAERGHSVTVIDRESAPAGGCSFGNAGLIALGHAEAWAGPEVPKAMARALFGLNPTVKMSKPWDPFLWLWGLNFLANCTSRAHNENSRKLLQLSQFSARALHQIELQEGLSYHQRRTGSLYLYSDERQYRNRIAAIRTDPVARQLFEPLSVEDLLELEPALTRVKSKLAGGLISKSDSSGDCALFTSRLAYALSASGRAMFKYNAIVSGFTVTNKRITAVTTDTGRIDCQGVVIAAGTGSRQLLSNLGVNSLIYPVKGYSATYDIVSSAAVPEYSAVDETELVAFSRFGDRLRLTGFAEMAGTDLSLRQERLDALDAYAHRTFGDAVDTDNATYWAGLRPATPSSLPYLGRLKIAENLWVNAGHGQLGWTMAAGSGRLIADLVDGRAPRASNVSASASWLEKF